MPTSSPPPAAPVRQTDKAPGANPYLNARREWDERYGYLLSRERNWRIAAAAALAVALVSVAGISYVGSQSKIQPFIIAVDALGSPVALARPQSAVRADTLDQRIIKAQIGNFIFNSRTFLSDFTAQQVLFDRTFAMLSNELAPQFTTFFRDERMPLQRNSRTVSVNVRTVLHTGGDTWQVNWTETISSPGQAGEVQNWRAILTIGVDEQLAARPDMFFWNPFGIFVRSVNLQREAA